VAGTGRTARSDGPLVPARPRSSARGPGGSCRRAVGPWPRVGGGVTVPVGPSTDGPE